MLAIELDKFDNLTLLINDLNAIAYLQSLVQEALISNPEDKTAVLSDVFLQRLNAETTRKLCDLVFAEDFALSCQKLHEMLL